jgi:anti-sigma factor RsiW
MTPLGMTCKELVELVTEYLEETLAPDERARFEAHLARCQGCTRYLEQMRQTIQLVGRLPEESIPETPREELLNLFRDWKKG